MTVYSRRGQGLSEAARAVLAEYTDDKSAAVIAKAAQLNPDETLTARDIADAIRLVERSTDAASSRAVFEVLSRSRAYSQTLLLGVALLSLLAGAAILFFQFSKSTGTSGSAAVWITGIAAYAAAVLAVATYAFSRRQERRSRSYAMRLAETDSSSSKFASLLAEAVDSAVNDTRASDRNESVKTVRFVTGWAQIEDRLRRLAQVALGMPKDVAADYPIGALLSQLSRSDVLPAGMDETIRDVLQIRNEVAHGRGISLSESSYGIERMELLSQFLDDFIERHAAGER